MGKYMQIGKVVNTHGIRGVFKIIPTTDDPTRFSLLDFVFLYHNQQRKKYEIEQLQFHKQFILLKCKEISTMDEAETLKGAIVEIPRSMALPLEENEYYIGDLYGLEVFTTGHQYLGKLTDIIFTGSNDVYVVEDPKNSSQKPMLLPAIRQCIQKIDLENKKMIVYVMEGLEEL
ncbi:MAG: 16S rRNA processing protein RimM [Epulopiscium sp.]|nr:16S rRNA processing protein RimM [Candidatus Epulonipiscium sp.]